MCTLSFQRGGVTECGHFVHIPDNWKHKAEKIFAERVFDFLFDEHKINDEIAESMRSWKHSGFTATIQVSAFRVPPACSPRIHALRVSVDNSVRIAKGENAGMQRLVQYIARCPFSLTRMVSITEEGKILYRASHAKCIPFPLSGDTIVSLRISER
ncbi:MAG: hypothetical protein GF398_17925 [Chitinivibrionales bacterium]|nr:hypothetical protein [Chitinivibrionales bacterium]